MDITLAEKQDFLRYMKKIADSLEKIAEREIPLELQESPFIKEVLETRGPLCGSVTLLQPGLNLSQWRVVSLKRNRAALDMIEEVLSYQENFPADNDYSDLTHLVATDFIAMPRKFFEDLKNILIGKKEV